MGIGCRGFGSRVSGLGVWNLWQVRMGDEWGAGGSRGMAKPESLRGG